jgi:hypothetical protein
VAEGDDGLGNGPAACVDKQVLDERPSHLHVPSQLYAMDSVKLVLWTALEGVADGNSRRSLDRHTGRGIAVCRWARH